MPFILTKYLKKFSLGFLTLVLLTLLIIYFQANLPLWKSHLEVDIWVWFLRMESFLENNSFSGLTDNEILPATLLYFFLPRLFAGWSQLTYATYLPAALMINLFIVALLIGLIRKNSLLFQSYLFLSIVLLTGPILLFRFDTLVVLLVVISLIYFQKNKILVSAITLGLAVSMKIYPIIFLPYFLLVLFKTKRIPLMFKFINGFFLSLFIPVFIFFLLGGDIYQLSEALNFHSLKYVSIESLPGSILTATSLITTNSPPVLLGGYGVWGITTPLIKTLGLGFFNYLWVLPIGLFYLYLIKTKRFLSQLNSGVFFLMMLIFLVFSKNLHPQYIWWFIPFFPLIKFKNSVSTLISFTLLCLIAFTNQLVYPLLYTGFIESFYQQGESLEIFYLLLLRNFSIFTLLIFSFTLLDKSPRRLD